MAEALKLISHEELLAELLQDPEFAQEYRKRMVFIDLAQRIYGARKALGKTQEEIADCAGLRLARYRAIESGDPNLSIKTLQRIADALGKRVVITLE